MKRILLTGLLISVTSVMLLAVIRRQPAPGNACRAEWNSSLKKPSPVIQQETSVSNQLTYHFSTNQ